MAKLKEMGLTWGGTQHSAKDWKQIVPPTMKDISKRTMFYPQVGGERVSGKYLTHVSLQLAAE